MKINVTKSAQYVEIILWGKESKALFEKAFDIWQERSDYVRNDTYHPDFIQELLAKYIKDNSNG
jgi:hypothetical protein